MIYFRICLLFTSFKALSGSPTANLPSITDMVPKPPMDLPKLDEFLATLLNVTTDKILDVASKFTFGEASPEHVDFLLFRKDGSVKTLKTYSSDVHVHDFSAPIKFIVHGWHSAGNKQFVIDMAKSFHKIGIDNVFSVDWSFYAKENYLSSSSKTSKVGEIIAKFIIKIIRNNTKLLKNVHLIGHSLGAQVTGFAGQNIQKLTNGHKVHRITALDAASPLFDVPIKLPINSRISKDDAHYVDSIHTNIGLYGFIGPIADADYYVNFGGPIQPGCIRINPLEAISCSHSKAYEVFNRTITSKNYLATSCENALKALANQCKNSKKVVMGEHTTTKAKGLFYIGVDKNNTPSTNLTVSWI